MRALIEVHKLLRLWRTEGYLLSLLEICLPYVDRLTKEVLQVTRTLMNTLFVQTQGSYLSLDHETIQVKVDGERKMQIPMHHIGGIVLFGNVMMSPFLVHRCAADGRHIILCDANGRFSSSDCRANIG